MSDDEEEVSRRFGAGMLALIVAMGVGFYVLFVVLDRSGEPLHDPTRRNPGGTIQRELDATPLIMTRENLRNPQPTIPRPETAKPTSQPAR
jgi:hypothetical protein